MVDAVGSAGEELIRIGGPSSRFEFIHHNLRAEMGLSVAAPLDFIIHAAGIASPYWYQKDPLGTIDVAVHGSRQCLELARANPGSRYLFTSSSEVYQTAAIVPTPETYVGAIPTMGNRSCYDISKAMGETLAHTYFEQFGVHAVVARIFNSIGVGMAQADHRILPRIGSAVVSGKPLQVFRNPSLEMPRRTYCPMANTIVGLLLALTRGTAGEVYNIGARTPEISTLDLISAVRGLGWPVPHEIVEQSGVYSNEPMRRCPDISKAHRELGYDPAVDFKVGLRRFMEWATKVYQP